MLNMFTDNNNTTSNAKRALSELTSLFNGDNKESKVDSTSKPPFVKEELPPFVKEDVPPFVKDLEKPAPFFKETAQIPERAPLFREELQREMRASTVMDVPKYDNYSRNSASVISANTNLSGNISTQGDLSIEGSIIGDTIATGKVSISGNVKGNIEAENLTVTSGRIDADEIRVKKNVIIEQGAQIIGSIECENITINSAIKGNLTVYNQCIIKATAIIQGDIKAKDLSVENGSVLTGKIQITKGREM